MNVSFFIAKNLFFSKNNNQRVSKLAVGIATMGVAVGLAIMILSVCVVRGFKNEISGNIVGFGGHIQILNTAISPSGESMPLVVDSAFCNSVGKVEGVSYVQRFSEKLGILKSDVDFKGIVLKGINENYDVQFLNKHIVNGKLPEYTKDSARNEIVISQTVANQMKLKVGNRIFAYFFEQSLKMRRFHVAGIYRTNLTQFDDNIILSNLYTVNQLNNWSDDQSTGVEIVTNDFSKVDNTYSNILGKVSHVIDRDNNTYTPFTIKELYAQVFDWLNLLDINIWVILGLMACVACITMISGLLIIVLEKTSTIGVLKALGSSNGLIRRTFLHYSLFIMGRGLLFGNVIGVGLAWLQDKFGLICLNPENYYVEAVPICFDVLWILILNLATIIICVFAFISPCLLISRVEPVKTMKFD